MPDARPGRFPAAPGRHLALVFLAAFVFFILALLPARLAWTLLDDRFPDVRLSGVAGSFWHGSAESAFYNDGLLGKVDWSWQPWTLFLGQWRNRVALSGGLAEVQGSAGLSITGNILARGLSLEARIERLVPLYLGQGNQPAMSIRGPLRVQLERLSYGAGVLDALSGRLDSEALNIAGTDIGALAADLGTENGGPTLAFRSAGDSDAGLEGKAALLPQGEYRLDLVVANPDALGSEVGAMIKGLAKPLDGGGWQISWAGRF